MIGKIRSRLSIKVFLITFSLVAVCCCVTYVCISCFAPYVYSHNIAEAHELAELFATDLSGIPQDEMPYFLDHYMEILSKRYDDEFVVLFFKSSGEEITLPELAATDRRIEDFRSTDISDPYPVFLAGSTEEYNLRVAKNTGKESQVVQALQKSLPLLSLVVLLVSIAAALFYSWYMTAPIKKVSRLSRQMAGMDFSGLCSTTRTDEIGVLAESLNTLSQKLNAALSDLQQANRKLQADIDMERRLERQRTDFFSAASHELKTPITIIKGQLQGMYYQVGRYKDRDLYLARSLEVADTLERRVQGLLTVSRLDTPGYECEKRQLDLSHLIDECLCAHEDLFVQKALSIEKSVLPDVFVLGDTPLLQKVLNNLVGNAAAYSPTGNHISVKLWQGDDKAILTIENTGVHIPDEDIPKLFEAFYRVDHSRNRQTGGTGLGLYIVKTILDLHGAEISIENTSEGVLVCVLF